MTIKVEPSMKHTYGVHEWVDQHGNHGTEVVGQHHIKVQSARVNGLFDIGHERASISLTDYFNPGGNSKRKVLVVVDSNLPETRKNQIEAYFIWCKMEKLLDDYTIMALAVCQTEKTFQQVLKVVTAAKHFRLKRRDLLVAIGSTAVTDIVGFTAATYRRSTPWILVPTDIGGIIHCSACDNKLSVSYNGIICHRELFAVTYPPIASFYDPSFLDSQDKDSIRCGLAEIIQISVYKDGELFSYVEAHLEKMFAGPQDAAYLSSAVELAARWTAKDSSEVLHGDDGHLYPIKFGDAVAQGIGKIRGINYDGADSMATGVALASALSFLKGYLCSADLGRILNLLEKAGLSSYDETLEADGLWEHTMGEIQDQCKASTFVIPMALGKWGYVNVTDLSVEDIEAALSVLRNYYAGIFGEIPQPEIIASTLNYPSVDGGFREGYHEQTASEDIQYHVVSVPDVFSPSNTTLIEEYCVDKTNGHKRKILVIADDYLGNMIGDIDEYFKKHSSTINDFGILSMHIDSNGKDIDSVLRVVDAAIDLKMSQRDLFIVVGGGTLMDIVGFAAAIFKGGIPYLRIATTLIGMIDAGIGVKTGVNFDNHKSLIGRYFAPVACLNDPETFLVTLPQREFACGLAEAIKMAILKSPRLFEVIERYQRNVEYNTYTHEVIHISIRTMLEELQPNLYEHDLRRLVDFGHEFGHIVESLARHEIPHGECVAIGMSISSFLAYMKGILPKSDLERILNCILNLGLPIYTAEYDCCNADILWAKIRSEGIEHKDGMLLLAVPEVIGRGSFLDNISDIDAGMVSEAVLSLRLYADRYIRENAQRTIALTEASLSALSNDNPSLPGVLSLSSGDSSSPSGNLSPSNGISSLPSGNTSVSGGENPISIAATITGASHHETHVIVVDIGGTYLRVGITGPEGLLYEPIRIPSPSKQSYPQDTLAMLQERLLETIASQINIAKASHRDQQIEEVGISFGAVITREGVVEDASILWNDSARGYDFRKALQERLPSARLTILNDVSAAAWRYKDEGRFCLITVSSGLSNKVFNPSILALDQLDLDEAGVGGEMGHVIVEPRAVDRLVQLAISQATTYPEELSRSRLNAYVYGDAQKITVRHLRMAVKERDEFSLRLLEEADVPYCPCGNLADLCSYSSGRGALSYAQRLAARGYHGIVPSDITDQWLQQAIAMGHPLALKVLYDSTYPLALRILQLAADIGLEKFIIVGGFAMRTGKHAYLEALQDHLVRFYHQSAFFGHWGEDKVRRLVQFGIDDDNDGLIGMGHFVQHLRTQYRAVEKAVGEHSLMVVTRNIPRCGVQEVLAKVVFSGICTTDQQILSGERGYEPTVLGHEGVFQVQEVGKDVKGLNVGEMIILNPNNPLDDYDKLGHTREGVFQEYIKFGQEFLERKQVLKLGQSAVRPTDTLVEPLSTVIAAQDRIKDRIPGSNVLIIGAGKMGLLFVSMMLKKGARNVFLANRSKERLNSVVARGIIQESKVFVIGESVSSQVEEVSAGKGVDIVIICVSRQGVRAAQDAIAYVNVGGCVYLFAGFRQGDMLALEGGSKVDVWSIRAGWKTERVQVAGKAIDLSGHRGSRTEDLGVAANVIRDDGISFGRMISHIISLDALPDIMSTLARDGNIQGVPAKRVIVDMTAKERVVETTEEFPLRHLHEATRKQKDAIPMGNLFREIGFQGNTSMLGWVSPPTWQEIKVTVETALQINPLNSKRHFIWVGTGPWVFLLNALKETIPKSQDIAFHTLQSLDPQALEDLFEVIEDLSEAICLGITQSGKTLETVLLMNALREHFDSAGLDYRNHFVWLTDTCEPIYGGISGQEAIRSLKDNDWKNVDMVPLTVGNHSDINALFCAPHSVVVFLPLVLLLHKDLDAMQHTYQQYLKLRDQIVRDILPKAYSVASNNIEHIQLSLDESIAPVLVRLVTQLVEQSLGSKQVGFNPRVRVAFDGKVADGFELVAVPLPVEIPAVVKVMLTMNALSTFVAMVAYHRRIEFVTHPQVDLYKRRAAELMAAAEVEREVSGSRAIIDGIITYLSANPRTCFVEVLCYGHVAEFHRQNVKTWLASCLASRTQNISINVVQGEEWNRKIIGGNPFPILSSFYEDVLPLSKSREQAYSLKII
ncbi:hypothetical protein B7494_g2630 [Chlorociboria aeruginascens]|nr:hypothetical protein B7494_g2630 [Chlorociboria aeruginascens]